MAKDDQTDAARETLPGTGVPHRKVGWRRIGDVAAELVERMREHASNDNRAPKRPD